MVLQPDAQKASLHNKWRYQVGFYKMIEDVSDEMRGMVKNAPKMGTPEFLAMFPCDGAKRLYTEIEGNVRTDLEGSTGAAHEHEANDLVLKIDGLETALSDLRDKLQQAEDAGRKLTEDAEAASRKLDEEKQRSLVLYESLKQAQEATSDRDSLLSRMRDVEQHFRDLRRNLVPSEGEKEAKVVQKVKRGSANVVGDAVPGSSSRKKSKSASGDAVSGSSSRKKSKLVDWGVRTDLMLCDMKVPHGGATRNNDILEAVKEQLGRWLSPGELHMIAHNNGPVLGTESAVYVGSAVSKTCRNDTDWYLQFHGFFLGFFRALRKAYDHVSTEYSMAVAEERANFEENMMARFVEINGAGKAGMAKKLFQLVAKHPVTGIDVTCIQRSLTNHWHVKAGKWLTYDVDLLGAEEPLVLTASAGAPRAGKVLASKEPKNAKASNDPKNAKAAEATFAAELSTTLADALPREGDDFAESEVQKKPISQLGSPTSVQFSSSPGDELARCNDGEGDASSSSESESDSD